MIAVARILRRADAALRGESSAGAKNPARDLFSQLALVIIFGTFYGAVMGTFSATSPQRTIQIFYSAVKVPMLLIITFAVGLPSFFVLNTLLGLRRDFVPAIRAIITTQAGLTIILASLSPLTALWYLSYADYSAAILFNAAMFALASCTAQLLLRRLYRPLIARNRQHRITLILWLVIYAFVGIQMGWVLRPFIGSPATDPRFFRENAFSNAYVEIAALVGNVIHHR